MTETVDRPVETAATRTTVAGWVCVHCGHFWGVNEHAARRCCATSQPCETCDNRTKAGHRHCDNCNSVRRLQLWHSRPAVQWDGQFPIGNWGGTEFFWDSDELLEYLEDHLGQPVETDAERLADVEDHWFTRCRPTPSRSLDLIEFLYDQLPEDADDLPPGGEELEDAVNAWLTSIQPLSWQMTGERLCPESIRKQILGEEK